MLPERGDEVKGHRADSITINNCGMVESRAGRYPAMLGEKDKVKIKIGDPEIRIIEQTHHTKEGTKYSIEFGGDFATRVWKLESELELVEKAKEPDTGGGFYPAEGIM